jgi:hypothetical protein
MTYKDLCEKLKSIDEITLMELLEINSDMLVDRFDDLIELKHDYLEEELEVDDIYDNDEY